MYPFFFSGSNQQKVTSTPHPELTPIYAYECEPPQFARSPMLSNRDYSLAEIRQAQAESKLTMDMMEYCHNNGISWEKSHRAGHRRASYSNRRAAADKPAWAIIG